jgi:N-acetylglutamate synthase-like GNAT family acetyltransferase
VEAREAIARPARGPADDDQAVEMNKTIDDQRTGVGEAQLRRAIPDDCAVLTALMLRSKAYQGRYRSIIERYAITPEMLAQRNMLVAERNGQVVGFYSLDLTHADLDLMFVDDAAQGSGLGRKLFLHMADAAAAAGLKEVTIVAHPPAADFYRRMGAGDRGVAQGSVAAPWERPIIAFVVQR